MTRPLTWAQSRVLAYVREFQRENQMPPTRAEIALHFHWKSPNAAEEHLQALERKGYVSLLASRSRGIKLTPMGQGVAA
jgi:repressor LexA